MWSGSWEVSSGIARKPGYLKSSRSALSLCPADSGTEREQGQGRPHWRYSSRQEGWTEAHGVSLKCSKHNKMIPGMSDVKGLVPFDSKKDSITEEEESPDAPEKPKHQTSSKLKDLIRFYSPKPDK